MQSSIFDRVNFDGFNNETGLPYNIVPNIIHLIRFEKENFSFIDICLLRAAHIAQNPDAIYIHTNVKEFRGKYWFQLQEKWPDTYQVIQIKYRPVPSHVYDRPLSSSFRLFHASDIERYRILSEYGGIYFDNDVYLIQNLDMFRKFEMTLEWNPGMFLGNQVLIAHKDARFLQHCLETFHDYQADRWYYNGGELPTTAVLYKYPQFIHRIIDRFGTSTGISHHLYAEQSWPQWKDYYAIHLLINHRHYMYKDNFQKYPHFDELTILQYNFTFGEMIRKIYFE